ncbi:MAG: EscU/YscU/HrcU family type III secretion system export apparatus switch protein [Candidatus Solibacter sp.]
MADAQKTEQPTKKRQDKAREEGQFPSAKQFVGGMQFCTFVFLVQSNGWDWVNGTLLGMRGLLKYAFAPQVSSAGLFRMSADMGYRCVLPLLKGGAVLVVVTLAVQLGITKFGLSAKKLLPDAKRMNPLSKLKQLPGQNFPAMFQALILLPLFGGAIYAVASEHLDTFMLLPRISVASGMHVVTGAIQSLMWKAAALFFVFGCVELLRETRKHSNELKMSKQEVKDEAKESEGNPHMKAKIRALRRDQARRRMMKDVASATAVVVNPTHFAVALKYDPDGMAAPMVVAKGKNYLALRIKQRALDNNVPLIENPPLAQALYKSVGVGQEIPPQLYKAVAEILAYIFKVMHKK